MFRCMLALSLLTLSTVASFTQEVMHIGVDAIGTHPNSCGGGIVRTYPASADLLHDTRWLSEQAGLTDVNIRHADIKMNACAIQNYGGKRYILFGRFLGSDADPEEKWASEFVTLAHEVGHLACRHSGYTADIGANWKMELEADRYAGFLIRKLVDKGDLKSSYAEGFLLGFVVNYMSYGRYLGGQTHPPDSMRKQAVYRGYYQKLGC